MKYHIISVTTFQQNCSLIWCTHTQQAALVDPGGNAEKIKSEVTRCGVTVSKILLSHGHLDHVGAAVELAGYYQIPILGPAKEDAFWLDKLSAQSFMFGLEKCVPFMPTQWLAEGDEVKLGEATIKVLHCPGHTPGHIVFINQQANLALVGDVLFNGGIGRTDFPYSSHQVLINIIRTKLLTQSPKMVFIPGHGPMSSFDHERQNNPFLREN